MKKYLFLCLVLFVAQEMQGQRVTLSREQALADIDTLVNRIVYTHPAPFTVCPEPVFRERIAQIKAELPDTLTDLEFGRKVIPCVGMLGDGHTFVRFAYPTPEQLLFPENVRIDYRDSSLTLNGDSAKVIRINDMPVKDMLGDMVQYIGGERMHFRFTCLQNQFCFFLNAFYPDSVYRLVLREPDGNLLEKTVLALPYKQIVKMVEAYRVKKGKERKKAAYAFQLSPDKKSMFFEFNSFYDLDKFKVFADSMFRELKERKIRNLIIDIRNNGGGDSRLGDELLQYLLHVPFIQFGKMQARVGRYTKSLNVDWKNITDTLFVVSPRLEPLRKEPLRVSKRTKVYLLTSNSTFSSAAAFSWAFQYFKGGIVVGEESGGMNVTFGDVWSYTLLHSRLHCGVSWKRFYHYGADDRDIHGTLPDVEVPADRALDRVKQLVCKGKK